MNEQTPETSHTSVPSTHGSRGRAARPDLLAALLFGLILLLCRSTSLGDTGVYANHIAEYLGQSPFGSSNKLWEFGHLIWRPLGWLLLTLASPVLSQLTDWTPFMQACFVLISVSVVSAFVTVILWCRMLHEETGSAKLALLLTLAFSAGHGFLLYSESGCAYIPGLACLTASLQFLRKNRIVLAALLYALAALLWFPYVLAGLALFLAAALPRDWRRWNGVSSLHLSRAILFAVAGIGLITAGYVVGALARNIGSFADAKIWYAGASHEIISNLRLPRLATGLPRTFLFMDKDGILLKRFLKHDPYAYVGIVEIVRVILWKLAIYYAFLLCLALEAWRRWSQMARSVILLLTVAGPLIYFAIFLFEPSAPERFLPAVPFLLLLTGAAFARNTETWRMTQWSIACFLVLCCLNNLYWLSALRVNAEDAASWSRVTQLRTRMHGASSAMVTTNQDRLEEYLTRSPFAEVNRPESFRLYDIIEPGSARMEQWREEFAGKVLQIWSQDGEVWLSTRVRSDKPQPEWNWVEKDDPREIWSEFSAFFQPLRTDMELDGPDGFLRLAQTEENVRLLAPFAAAYKKPASPGGHE
ncbi:MAG: hypothetical protein ABL967_12095 [Bryobacteraceae bacterium]